MSIESLRNSLAGRYTIECKLGEGGMATAFPFGEIGGYALIGDREPTPPGEESR